MSAPQPIIKADYVDLKFLKGRKVCQLHVEFPIEQGAEFIRAFGAPNPAVTVPVAIARLDPDKAYDAPIKPASEPPTQSSPAPIEKIRRRFSTLPLKQQCAMRCAEPAFQRFLSEVYATNRIPDADDAAALVRSHCGVASRSEIVEGSDAAKLWLAIDSEFDLWMKVLV